MNDTLTLSALRQACRAAIEEARRHQAAGRSIEFAEEAAESFFAPRAAAALEAHEARRTVEHRAGKDFKAEAKSCLLHALSAARGGVSMDRIWSTFWVNISAAVQPKELF